MSNESALNRHYGDDILEERVETVLKSEGLDRYDLTWTDLARFDQFHVGGAEMSRALAEAAGVRKDDDVLDIGSGLGGPARMLAATYGCHVTGLDLNPAYARIATNLSARAQLADRTTFVESNALAMPFADGTFTLAWTQHAAMNIADKSGLYREIHRVLKPGGRLAIHDVVLGNGKPLEFPLPWSPTAELSAVVSPETLRAELQGAGFAEVMWRDMTGDAKAFFASIQRPEADSGQGAPAPANLTALIGPQFAPLLANMARHIMDGRLAVIQTIQQAG